ncbi:SDR family NAD(P)-dependent oxidoreductase [Antarctobacter sp.]|uniref:SDR family NAD(P)-dependent oxidoreductase n=1 Tax=Antarctobacter sp. TaxID=1872577 RepID=UPI003A8C91A2
MTQENAYGLAGQVCVVTGGASGIGRGIALAFAREGARVAVLDVDESGAAETVRLADEAGAEGVAIRCDTADPQSIDAARRAVEARFGAVGVLVNNAGILGRGGPLMDLPVADWDRLMNINLRGYFLCAQAFGGQMTRRGSGAIVNVVSITAETALPNSGNYGIAKAGAAMMTKLLAAELGPHGVRCNAVHPGIIQTALNQASFADPAIAAHRNRSVPMGRVGQPRDIAEAVLFLASPRAGYVNGAELLVDGAIRQGLLALASKPS